MKLLKQSLTQPLNKHPHSVGVILLLITALIGFADASYLTVEHYRNAIPPCTTSGCETVLTSQYSVIFGIPVPLLGVLDYLAISLGLLIFLESKHVSGNVKDHHRAILKWTMIATVLGFVFSAWFVYLQAFVIHAFCQYCLGSATTSTILFIVSIYLLRKSAAEDVQTLNGTQQPTI